MSGVSQEGILMEFKRVDRALCITLPPFPPSYPCHLSKFDLWPWHNNVSIQTCSVYAPAWLIFQRDLSDQVEQIMCCVILDVALTQYPCSPCHVFFVVVECQAGFFKAEASGEKCKPCPANTQRLDSGALFCPCMEGFYRAPTDSLTGPCSGITSPRSLKGSQN